MVKIPNGDIIALSIKAALSAGDLIRNSKPMKVRTKSVSDYVTEIDMECQIIIKKTIKEKYPDHSFLAEEDGGHFSVKNDLWIIDPLDGTTNFIHGLGHSAVSIAFYTEGRIVTGVVYDPFKEEMFSAVLSEGAKLNGHPIKVSEKRELSQCLVATGMPFKRKEKAEQYFICLKEILKQTSGVRRMGSAALDLAYTACGRFDCFFEGWLSPWDIAAGILILTESGGVASDFRGEDNYMTNGSVIASGKNIFDPFFKEVNNYLENSI